MFIVSLLKCVDLVLSIIWYAPMGVGTGEGAEPPPPIFERGGLSASPPPKKKSHGTASASQKREK